jgi:hypothetical protein
LMSPSAMTSSESESPAQGYAHNNSSEVSYSDNCLSCHSQAELDDRYYDMQRVGMVTAHGISIDQYGWQAPSTGVPWWYQEIAPVPPTGVSASSSAPVNDAGSRRRTTGSTRGGDDRPRSDGSTEASAPAPTTTTSSAPPPPIPTAVTRDRSTTSANPPATERTRTSGNTTTPTTPPAPRPESKRRDD